MYVPRYQFIYRFMKRRANQLHADLRFTYAEILDMLASRGSERFSQIGWVLLSQEKFFGLVSLKANINVALCQDCRKSTLRTVESRIKIILYEDHAIYLTNFKARLRHQIPF